MWKLSVLQIKDNAIFDKNRPPAWKDRTGNMFTGVTESASLRICNRHNCCFTALTHANLNARSGWHWPVISLAKWAVRSLSYLWGWQYNSVIKRLLAKTGENAIFWDNRKYPQKACVLSIMQDKECCFAFDKRAQRDYGTLIILKWLSEARYQNQ